MTLSIDPATAFVTFLMVLAIFWLGWKQIAQLREQLVSQLQVSQSQIQTILQTGYASLLPQTSARFDSPYIEESTRKERELLRLALEECKSLSGQTKEQRLRACFLQYVQELRDKNDAAYEILMRRCYFFEDIGFYCRKGYLLWGDVAELYGMPICRTYLLLAPHISDRRKEEGEKTFECFVELAEEAAKVYPRYQAQLSV